MGLLSKSNWQFKNCTNKVQCQASEFFLNGTVVGGQMSAAFSLVAFNLRALGTCSIIYLGLRSKLNVPIRF